MSCHSVLARKVSAEKSPDSLVGIPLCEISYFSLTAFKIFSLFLTFDNLIIICLGVDLLELTLFAIL